MYLYMGPLPPLVLDQTEARRAEKIFLEDRPPPYLRVWMTSPPPHYLMVLIRYCMYMYSKRNDPNKGFSLQPASTATEISLCGHFANTNFRPGEISRVRIFSPTKIRQNEISLQWMRNFAKMTAKFRLTQRKFTSALTKFRGEISSNFRESKERKTPNLVLHSISFAQYCTRNIFLPLISRSTCYTLNNVISFEFK